MFLTKQLPQRGMMTENPFTPRKMFLQGEEGVWYDPSDMATLFQDSAGTTPVTAVEQAVGKILDKSGKGNHATQPTSSARPVLSARVNLLTNTISGVFAGQTVTTTAGEHTLSFSGTGKILLSGTATGTYSAGTHTITTTAGTLQITPVGDNMTDDDGNTYPTVIIGGQTWMAKNLNVGVYTPSVTGADHSDVSNNGTVQKYCYENIEGNCATYGGLYDWNEMMGYTETEGARGICPAGWHIPTDTEWKTLEMALGMTQAQADSTGWRGTDQGTKLKAGGTSGFNAPLSGYRSTNGAFSLLGSYTLFWSSSPSSGSAWYRYLGSGGSTVYRYTGSKLHGFSVRAIKDTSYTVTNVDFRRTNDGVGLPTYQRVTTEIDYDTVGFPKYLKFDGVDDFLVSNSIDFSATDEMTVWSGVRKLSDGTQGMVSELSATTASNNGSFSLQAPAGASATYAFQSKGTVLADAQKTGVASPLTSVLTGTGDISGDTTVLRVNGVQAEADTGDQGTGNYGNYPLYIGMRGGTSLPFSGRVYGLVVRGKTTIEAQIKKIEKWVNLRTKAY